MSNGNGEKRATGDAPQSQVQSVDRALSILGILARQGEAGVTEIAAELDVHKSTAFRLVVALENHDLVEQIGDRGKYRLGFGIVRLAGATTAKLDISRESRPVCERLAAELGETVNVAVLDGGAAIYVSQEQGRAAVSVTNWIGQRTPLHATSTGKVLLAWAGQDQLTALLENRLLKHTDRTITGKAALRAELEKVRERGWACTSEELEIGLNAVAAPIRDGADKVVAAVCVSGPSFRLTVESFPAVAGKLLDGAREISTRIGNFGSARP